MRRSCRTSRRTGPTTRGGGRWPAIGPTPASFTERSGYHKKCAIRAELEGYQPWTQEFAQDHPSKILVPSVVGSYYLLFPVVGVLWGYQLPDEVTLFLKPTGAD